MILTSIQGESSGNQPISQTEPELNLAPVLVSFHQLNMIDPTLTD